jgi:hypothetical protein
VAQLTSLLPAVHPTSPPLAVLLISPLPVVHPTSLLPVVRLTSLLLVSQQISPRPVAVPVALAMPKSNIPR